MFRQGVRIFQTEAHVHSFNTPVHVSHVHYLSTVNFVEGCIAVEEGDWIVMSTDGVHDNFDSSEFISRAQVEGEQIESVSEAVMKEVVRKMNAEEDCPFSLKGRSLGLKCKPEGKKDDATLILASAQKL